MELQTNFTRFVESFFKGQEQPDIYEKFLSLKQKIESWFTKESPEYNPNFEGNIICDMNINNNLSNSLNKQMLFSITNETERFTIIISASIEKPDRYHIEMKKYDDNDNLKSSEKANITYDEITSDFIINMISKMEN